MSRHVLLSLLSLAGLLTVSAAPAGTLGYPTMDQPAFLIDVPDEWAVEAGESEGDYGHVNSDSGVYLALRTLEASGDSVKTAIEDSVAYVQENYSEVQLGEPKETEQAGKPAFYMDGAGKDKEGDDVVFRMAWIRVDQERLAEVWFSAVATDAEGIAAASAALSSIRTP